MKKQKLSKFTAIVLLVTIVSLIAIASTYAKYSSNFTGSGSATAADWNIEVSSDGTTFEKTFTLTNSDKLYPGSTGKLGTITVKNSSKIVSAKIVKVELQNVDGAPSNLTLSADIADKTAIAPDGTDTLDINYDWKYTTDDETSYANKPITFKVVVTVDQVI